MTLNAQQIIEAAFKEILGSLLDKDPWDPLFGASLATAASDFDKAAGICEEVLEFVTEYLSRLRRRRNDELAATRLLPPELLIRIWKYTTPKGARYYKLLGPHRLTSTRWAEIIDNDPSFWTILSCANAWEQAESSLEKSGTLPLDVYFPCRDACPEDFGNEDGGGADWTHEHWSFLQILLPEVHRESSYEFQFPALYSLKIRFSWLSASQALQFLAASPTLTVLVIEGCDVRASAELPPTMLQSRLRHIRIDSNRPSFPDGSVASPGLANIIGYVSSSRIERFFVHRDETVKVEMHSLGAWLAVLSERYPATSLRVWARVDSEELSVDYGSNCSACVVRPKVASIPTLVLALVRKIHPSAVPSLARVDIDVDDSDLSTILPELALCLPNITHLVMPYYCPLSWSVLGRAAAPILPCLEVLELYHTGKESETGLFDLLRTRSSLGVENSGWEPLKVVILSKELSPSILESVEALGLNVKMRWSTM